MRPPEFTGGNILVRRSNTTVRNWCFNEAAGIHRRKLGGDERAMHGRLDASMRPPEFTGGNSALCAGLRWVIHSFNEAAGIHRRKLCAVRWITVGHT